MQNYELLIWLFSVHEPGNHTYQIHVLLIIGNTTAVAHINHMGGTHSKLCNAVTRDMLLWCKARGIWLSAVFIPGKYNVKADWESRHFSDNTEWKLS